GLELHPAKTSIAYSNDSDRRTSYFFLTVASPTYTYTLSLHDALPISQRRPSASPAGRTDMRERHSNLSRIPTTSKILPSTGGRRSEEHTSELQSRGQLVCRLLLEKKNQNGNHNLIELY